MKRSDAAERQDIPGQEPLPCPSRLLSVLPGLLTLSCPLEVHHPPEREEGKAGSRKAGVLQDAPGVISPSRHSTTRPGPRSGLWPGLPSPHCSDGRETSTHFLWICLCLFCYDLGQLEICVMYDIPVLIALLHCESWLESLTAGRAVVEDCCEGRVFV